jgi:ABC-type antimicrobial peptide transport system permease subunit
VLRRGLRAALAGVALGTAGALLATRAVRTLLFGVTPTDGATYALAAAALVAVSAVASWLPARRATRVDPMIALRSE